VNDAQWLEELRQSLGHCAAALVAYRTELIESLGDSLCGLGQGPVPDDVARLERLEQMHEALRRAYGDGLKAVSQGSQSAA
jgi:hypothetical protein